MQLIYFNFFFCLVIRQFITQALGERNEKFTLIWINYHVLIKLFGNKVYCFVYQAVNLNTNGYSVVLKLWFELKVNLFLVRMPFTFYSF